MRTRIAPILIIAAALLLWSFETGAKTSKAPGGARPSKLVYINTYRFDPLIGLPDLPAGLRYAPSPQERTAYIVQFKTSTTGSMKQDLEALGIRVLGYVPVDAYLVEADARQVDDARRLASVRWAGLLEPAFKLSPDLAVEFDQVINRSFEELQSPEERAAGNRPERVDSTKVLPVRLRVVGRGKAQDVAGFLRSNDATEVTEPRHEGGTVGGTVPRGLLHRLAQQPDVIWIERKVPVSFANDRAAWVVQSNDPQTKQKTEYLRGLSGLGQTITIGDSGIDWDHNAFVDFLGNGAHKPPAWDHRKVTAYYVPADAGGDCHENPAPADPYAPPDSPPPVQHGTHVAGTVAGDDATWGVFDGNGIKESDAIEGPGPHDGIAYRAQLQVQDLSRFSLYLHPPDDLHDLFGPALDPSLRTQNLSQPDCPPVTPPAPASFIHTNSWGEFTQPSYTVNSGEIDDSMWGNPDLLVLFAAGNRGDSDGDYSIGPHAVAKNSLTVGASGNGEDANDFATDPNTNTRRFSSRGPTCDGRIKPDVMAPGRSLWSAQGCDPARFGICQSLGTECDSSRDCRQACNIDGCEITAGTCDAQHPCPLLPCIPPPHGTCPGYRRLTGTSMATPVAAGAAALVREYYMGGYYPGGTFTPSGALIKATLINGAQEMTGAGAYENGENFYPNDQQGWGRINLDQSLKFQGETQLLEVHDERVGVSDDPDDHTMSYTFNVTPTCGPLKVTLVWTDPAPGMEIDCNTDVTQLTAPTLVNNLDLVVRSPQGTVYWGDVFAKPSSPGLGHSVPNPDTDPNLRQDDRNNVEGVIVLAPLTAGTWTVEVTGKHIGSGNGNPMRQPFALVINCTDQDNDGDPDNLDCAPLDPTVHHGAAEVCNGKDDNCDGAIDEGFGTLTCGVGACQRTVQACLNGQLQDCVPGSPGLETVNLPDTCYDSVDNDCDGITDLDCAIDIMGGTQSFTSGSVTSGSVANTGSGDDQYEVMTETGASNAKQLCVVQSFWTSAQPAGQLFELRLEGFRNASSNDAFQVSYVKSGSGPGCTSNGWTATPLSVTKTADDDQQQTVDLGTFTQNLWVRIRDSKTSSDSQPDTLTLDSLYVFPSPIAVGDYASAADKGTLLQGAFSNTYTSNDSYEMFQEALVGNVSRLVHTWKFVWVPSGSSHQLHLEGNRTQTGGDQDDFQFYWSTVDPASNPNETANFTLITNGKIAAASDTTNGTDYAFGPATLSGTIYIRVIDTKTTTGTVLDTLNVDHLAIKTVP